MAVAEKSIKKRILRVMEPYIDFNKHKDLIAFSVCGESFSDYESEIEADFNELVVITEKDWLFDIMKKDGIKNPLKYLQEEYTSEDGFYWFNKAALAKKVVCVDFN